ncbi:MAG: hypothetical protein HUU15_14820 [Candidatus Brocadiae bacterium]|nr:hypothetical protein [Candidatus Brocadiia bacterium]
MKALILRQEVGWDGKPESEPETTTEGSERDVRCEMARVLRSARESGCSVCKLPTPGWKPGTARRWGVNAGAGGLTEFVLLRISEGV